MITYFATARQAVSGHSQLVCPTFHQVDFLTWRRAKRIINALVAARVNAASDNFVFSLSLKQAQDLFDFASSMRGVFSSPRRDARGQFFIDFDDVPELQFAAGKKRLVYSATIKT